MSAIRSRASMHCSVSLPDGTVLELSVSPKADGREILEKACESLEILETDYFGLSYSGSKGEELWLNLRNRVDSELHDSPPHRLNLLVKFYIKPHMIQQASARRQFYLNVRQSFLTGQLRVPSPDTTALFAALIAQSELGDCPLDDIADRAADFYSSALPRSVTDSEPSTASVLSAVVQHHAALRGCSRESAQYRLVQEAAGLDSYGVRYYSACRGAGNELRVGVGPEGITLLDENWTVLSVIQYQAIHTVTHDRRSLLLQAVDDTGTSLTHTFRLVTHRAANALYRAMTEIHSFYRCDTVGNDIATQFSRDLKGTLASLFNENTELGKRYVFDIQRTFCEAYDRVRRILYTRAAQAASSVAAGGGNELEGGAVGLRGCEATCEPPQANAGRTTCNTCQVMKETVQRIQDALVCHICADADINSTFVPCGHIVSCMGCAQRLPCCPICKAPISAVQVVFMPCLKPDSPPTAETVVAEVMASCEDGNSEVRVEEAMLEVESATADAAAIATGAVNGGNNVAVNNA